MLAIWSNSGESLRPLTREYKAARLSMNQTPEASRNTSGIIVRPATICSSSSCAIFVPSGLQRRRHGVQYTNAPRLTLPLVSTRKPPDGRPPLSCAASDAATKRLGLMPPTCTVRLGDMLITSMMKSRAAPSSAVMVVVLSLHSCRSLSLAKPARPTRPKEPSERKPVLPYSFAACPEVSRCSVKASRIDATTF